MSRLDNKTPKVLALSVDTASPGFIEAGCREGIFPHLRNLKERGAWGDLESVCNVSSGCIWPSMYTGCLPARHGIANFHMQLVKGTYHIDRYSPDQVLEPPFWDVLGTNGRRSVIVDVPLTRPHPGMNGVMISAWGVEGPAWKQESHPPSLMRRILRQIGPYPFPNDDYRRSIRPETREQHGELREILLKGLVYKTRLLRCLLETESWDFFLGVFSESHWADHVMYQTCDPGHPDHRPELAGEFNGFFREFFEAQDAAIGELTELVTEDTFVIVFSGSGVRPNYSANHLLPDVLDRLGVGPQPDSGPGSSDKGCVASAHRYSYYRIRQIQDTLSPSLISSAKRLVPRRLWDTATRRLLFAGSNWASSRAFCIPNDFCGSIRVNLKGREPRGTVDSGEYDGFCDELTRELSALTNETTGRPAVQQVIKIRDIMTGEAVDGLPDLSVVWADDAPFTGLQSPGIGTVRGQNPERRTGAHHNSGFVVLAGPGVPAGRRIAGARLIDLAPTILHVMGVPDTRHRDGGVLLMEEDDKSCPSV